MHDHLKPISNECNLRSFTKRKSYIYILIARFSTSFEGPVTRNHCFLISRFFKNIFFTSFPFFFEEKKEKVLIIFWFCTVGSTFVLFSKLWMLLIYVRPQYCKFILRILRTRQWSWRDGLIASKCTSVVNPNHIRQ